MTILRHPEAPPPACADCHARGHYCPGTVTAEDGKIFLCFACDAGEPCAQTKTRPSTSERVDALAQRAEKGNPAAGLKAARVLRTKESKMSPVSRIAQAGRSMRERFDRDETEPTAEPEPQVVPEPDIPSAYAPDFPLDPILPPGYGPKTENVLFDPANRAHITYVTGAEAQAERLNAISTVIRDLQEERARLFRQMGELDAVIAVLGKTQARWAAPAEQARP